MFVLFLALFLYQKWKGDCFKCKSLQQTIDKYVTGQLVPISKQTCKERDSYFAEQASKREMEESKGKEKAVNRETTWSLGFKAGPEYRHSLPEVHVNHPLIAPQAPDQVPCNGPYEAKPSRPRSVNSYKYRDSSHSTHFADSYSNRTRSSTSSKHYQPKVYKSEGIQNPYRMNGIPNGEERPCSFSTYIGQNEDTRNKEAHVRPDRSQSSLEQLSAEGLARDYQDACREAGRSSNPCKEEAGKLASVLNDRIQERHRSGVYGRITPPVSLPVGLQDVDLERQEEKEDKKPGWSIWRSGS
jgi:hypothetical protein